MATIRLPADFRDFLKLLNSHRVEYLLIGGYAVSYHGYYRNTSDIDLWVAVHAENARKLVGVIREFGFDVPELKDELFQQKGRIIRMGVETTRTMVGIPVRIISRSDLIRNKLKSGRLKDLDDAQKLS